MILALKLYTDNDLIVVILVMVDIPRIFHVMVFVRVFFENREG